MKISKLAFLAVLPILASCSLFKDDEEIKIHNPKPGTELDIKEAKIDSK